MAVVRAFTVPGCRLWFWSADHEPPHFHVKHSGHWEVKVHFLLHAADMIEDVWIERRPPASVLRNICDLAQQHRVELLRQWEEIHG